MTETFPQLSITTLENGNLRLEDASYGDGAIVDLHPAHVRHMAELLGFVRETSAPDADTRTTAEMGRDIDRLQRSLLRVRDHALRLHRAFVDSAEWRDADLTHEMGLAGALVDLLDWACDDFADGYTATDPVTGAALSGGVTRESSGVPRDTHGTNANDNQTPTNRFSAAPAAHQQLELPA